MSTATPYKVVVKLGQAEFSAEGPVDIVKEQLAHFFIAATQPQPVHTTTVKDGGASNGNGHAPGEQGATSDDGADIALRTAIDPAIVNRLFKLSADGVVTLRALPKTDERAADTLMLILWGYYVLKNQTDVTARDLLAALRLSGITSLGRVDETLGKRGYDAHVRNYGSRSGKTYSLANSGLQYAEQLASQILR